MNPWVAIPRPRKPCGYILARYTGFMRREFYKESGAIRVFNYWHEANTTAQRLNEQ